jgi:geranylgeranyl diphosphate synthase type I
MMQTQPEARPQSFALLARATKTQVDHALEKLAAREIEKAEKLAPDAGVVMRALFDLATRGGKRLRPALVSAANLACGGDGASELARPACGVSAAIECGVALEVIQAYLLIHDDWMDKDDVRRGGPSVHASLRATFGDRDAGDACAILAGDYAQGLALDLITQARVPPARMVAAVRELASMLTDVVTGQILDVRGAGTVETIHRLKTSSYTTRAPLALGAILAGADASIVEGLRAAGEPMGVAFQLQDDLLGTFGDPKKTGKSARSDLKQGKRTALIAELEGDAAAQAILPRVLGVADATDADVDALLARMVDSGAKARVEARRAELVARASAEIDRLAMDSEGKRLLHEAAAALAKRED